MASIINLHHQMVKARRFTAKTATATLVKNEVRYGFVSATSGSSVALTMPDVDGTMKGYDCLIAAGGAGAVTVVDSDGFGGGADTFTLAQGDMVHMFCDGVYWYGTNVTTSA